MTCSYLVTWLILLLIQAYLPSTACSAVIRESVTDPGVNVIQTQLPLRCSWYCHGNESGVAMRGFPFTVRRGGLRHRRYEVAPLPHFIFLLVPLPSSSSSSLFTRAQAADSQLGQPVYAGETGVQVRGHCLSFCLSSIWGIREWSTGLLVFTFYLLKTLWQTMTNSIVDSALPVM